MGDRLPGGRDQGAELVEGTVRRPVREWSPSVHQLLRHLERQGFTGAPRFLGVDEAGREVLTHLSGETVAGREPWPPWTHSDEALDEIGDWLRRYHDAVASFVPPAGAVWRDGVRWSPGLVVGHGDPAPYNAVWSDDGLVGLIDLHNAGPVAREDDLAWVAFSWTPLHAPEVVRREGFTDLDRRLERLERVLTAYGWSGTTREVVARIDSRLQHQVAAMRAIAARGDPTYRRMLAEGQDRALETARAQLATLWP